MRSPCYPTDFSPLSKGAKRPTSTKNPHVAIFVTANGHNKELPYAGVVAVDGTALIHTDLDELGIGSFLSEAIARVTAAMPTAHIQATLEIFGSGLVSTGVVVPCPPRPPRYEVFGMPQVFKVQHEMLAKTYGKGFPKEAERARLPGKLPTIANRVVAKSARTPVAKAGKPASSPRK